MPCEPPIGLTLTGERTLPGLVGENYWFRRHLACYQWLTRHLGEARPPEGPVLDAGSGEGYGASLLQTQLARPVVAVELDVHSVTHCHSRYPQVDSVLANVVALPFATASFAATVSLQVIEHIWDPVTYVCELARCTSGPIALSTPNRLVHSPGLAALAKPENPFHVREFDATEMHELLQQSHPTRRVHMFGVRHGPRIRAWEDANGPLPDAVLAGDPKTMEFAALVDTEDFTITRLADPLSSFVNDDVHDLIALW